MQNPTYRCRSGYGPVVVATGLCVLLAGCGFHLRGSTPVPDFLQPLALDCDSSVPKTLCLTVQEQLELGGVEVIADVASASSSGPRYQLSLSKFSENQRTSAITSRAVAAEYVLRQTVTVTVRESDRSAVGDRENPPAIILAPAEVAASESYRYDETDVLAKRQEAQLVRDTLQQRVASQILYRLAPLEPPSVLPEQTPSASSDSPAASDSDSETAHGSDANQ